MLQSHIDMLDFRGIVFMLRRLVLESKTFYFINIYNTKRITNVVVTMLLKLQQFTLNKLEY